MKVLAVQLVMLLHVQAVTHKYKLEDLGPMGPFVDENGQCQLDPCDALGRARDELYVALSEKEKVQAATGSMLGELKTTVYEGRSTQMFIQEFMKQMERRIRSLEQPGTIHHTLTWPNSLSPRSAIVRAKGGVSWGSNAH